jgi:hypothetical protein
VPWCCTAMEFKEVVDTTVGGATQRLEAGTLFGADHRGVLAAVGALHREAGTDFLAGAGSAGLALEEGGWNRPPSELG